MNPVTYIKNKGIKRAIEVICQYKIDILFQKILTAVYKNRSLLDSIVIESHNDFDSNGGAFYDYLINNRYNEKYRIIWLLRNKAPKDLPKNVVCFKMHSPSIKKDYYIVNSKYILTCQDSIGAFRNGQKAYYLTHGAMALKNTKGNISVPNSMTYILAPSEYLLPIQANLLSITYPNDKQVILGYPCHDALHNIQYGEGDIKKVIAGKSNQNSKMGQIQGFNKVIIWMPTFRKLKSGDRIDSDVEFSMGVPILKNIDEFHTLDERLAKTNVFLIIKIHPMQDMDKIKIRSTNNISILDGSTVKELEIDNYRLMVDTDAMITDYSSSGTDYLQTQKPLAYTVDDINEYKLGFIIENIQELMPGRKIYALEDLLAFVDDVVEGRDEYVKERREVLEKMFKYYDGRSCQRLAEHMGIIRDYNCIME